MQIRLASLKDIEDIMGLIKNCIKDMESQGIYQWNDYYPTAEIFEEDIKSDSLYILEDESNCLGFVSINEDQSPEYKELLWLNDNDKVLVIHRLAVNPKWQKQGIGRRLMDFAENFATKNQWRCIKQ